ncbi:MAG TPA: hypothetical protein VIH58_01970, partial [Chthoniobacterales bacterium]
MMMNYTCRLKRFLGPATAMALLVLVLLGGPLTALGQTSTGAIEGEVTDAQGKYLSGAKVTVRQPA